jgi:lipopolysaccharide transport system ATP-binding protein
MSDIVLKVEDLYKRYRLGTVDRQAFKEDIISWWAKVRGKPDPFEQYITSNDLAKIKDPEVMKKLKARYVWALQNINLEIKQGEIVGIIGKNGAGKSTLLKILSKTTTPTKGQVKVKGRIASLLEVGTGFHGELTGKENIYLNGAILGMSKHEIKSRLDEIVDFAGIDAYIDTPVKRYSSGMYVRLAFAVGAHLLADILIVDEVLAVGDAEFQRKCINKMSDISKNEGKTILFVSHNMQTIKQLCNKGVLLRNGTKVNEGLLGEVVSSYLLQDSDMAETGIIPDDAERSTVEGEARFKRIAMIDNKGREGIKTVLYTQKIKLLIDIEVFKPIQSLTFGLYVMTLELTYVGMSLSRSTDSEANMSLDIGKHKLEIDFDNNLLPGNYTFNIACFHYPSGRSIDFIDRVYDFEVLNIVEANEGHFSFTKYGSVYLETKFSIK